MAVGLPFVVRAVQPVLQDFDAEVEEAAGPWARGRAALSQVILPALAPALVTGFALAFARAVGEYGSVIFIAGNMPMRSEIAPLLIVIKLEEYDYAGAAAVGLAMLVISFGACCWSTPSRWRWAQGGRPEAARIRLPGLAPLMLALAVAVLGLLIVMPLGVVFGEAFGKGLTAYLGRVHEPDTWAAIRLTLLVAAIAVPLNAVFGLAAAWAIARFEFRGKSLLLA